MEPFLSFFLYFKAIFNLPLIISYFIFLFGSQYLGSILNWYGLGWWDTFIHFFSGVDSCIYRNPPYNKRIIQTKINDKFQLGLFFYLPSLLLLLVAFYGKFMNLVLTNFSI